MWRTQENWKLKETAGEFSKINGCKVNIKSSFPVFKKPVRLYIKMNENTPFIVATEIILPLPTTEMNKLENVRG